MSESTAAGAARIAAGVLRLENIARAQRLRLDADLGRLRAQVDAQTDAILGAAQRLRDTSEWSHALCRWTAHHAARRALVRGGLATAIGRLEHDAHVVRSAQRHWATLRRGLERRAARRTQGASALRARA